jgi:biopolymer transport protein ExbB
MQYITQIIDYGIIGSLLLMSVISFAVFIERFIFFKKIDIRDFKNKELLKNSLTNNITIIETIASNAPYIGLLGTVLAIMQTFLNISQTGLNSYKVAQSLALALKTTAIGLLVAIVSIFFYNYLARKVETILANFEK